MDDLLLIGFMGRAHGVRGEVKVIPETDDPERFSELETVYVGTSAEAAAPRRVTSVRYQEGRHGVTVLLKLEGIDGREDAEALRDLQVYARADDLPPLEEDELYLHDLIGLSVVTHEGEPVGTVKDVLETPAQYVYIVARPGSPDVMIPAVPAFIEDIDLEAERIVVRPIEGLLE